MDKLIYRIILFLFLILSISLPAAEDIKYQIIFTDNTAATGGPNDMGQTGDLEFIYSDPDDRYKFSAKGELFVNTRPHDSNVTRENPNNIRLDVLSVYFIQGDAFKYGLGFELLGNLGGDSIQNAIHYITNNPKILARYSGDRRSTPTLNFEYRATLFHDKVNFLSTGKIPFIAKNGITTFDAMFTYTRHDLYNWNMDAGFGLGFDCTKYPNMIAFKGSPIGEYQVCTPESKLSVQYHQFDFFWEIPLMNNTVQNSVLGISYKF